MERSELIKKALRLNIINCHDISSEGLEKIIDSCNKSLAKAKAKEKEITYKIKSRTVGKGSKNLR